MTPYLEHSQRMADLLLFARVAERGSFTAAAQSLGIGKSFASKQVRRLEKGLSTTLLHRTTRRLVLTEAGRALLEHAQAMSRAVDAATDAAASHLAHPSGRLRVTASVAYGRAVLAPLLPGFHRLCPDVEVELLLTDRYVDLWDEGLDLALRLTGAPAPGLAGRPLHESGFVLCATPAFLRVRRIRDPADLAGVPCMAFGSSTARNGARWGLRRGAERVEVEVRGPVSANSSDVIRELVLGGMGVGLLPTFAVNADLASRALRRVLPQWTPEGAFGPTAWALWPPQRAMAPKLRAMVDYLATSLGPLPCAPGSGAPAHRSARQR
jgi:DNA-binding transcriptional LysR family regulator